MRDSACEVGGLRSGSVLEGCRSTGHAVPSCHRRARDLPESGNASTNTTSLSVLRYGMMRDLVLGLEVVLPNRQIWNGLHRPLEDNTGYGLRQFFIGTEGTLGIVTAPCMRLFPRPTQMEMTFLAVESATSAIGLCQQARRDLPDLMSAFEGLPRRSIEMSPQVLNSIRASLHATAPYYGLMEISAGRLVDPRDVIGRLLGSAFERRTMLDGAMAANLTQLQTIRWLREGIVEAQARRGRHLRTDVSVPIGATASFLEDMYAEVMRQFPFAYGHLGDGNIHFGVLAPEGVGTEERTALFCACEKIIFTAIDRWNGPIGVEHGSVVTKGTAFFSLMPESTLAMQARVKGAFDLRFLMNPERILEPVADESQER